MPTREEALAELYVRDKLNPRQREIVEELARRGRVVLPEKPGQMIRGAERSAAMAEIAEEVGPLQAFLIGAGKGFYNVGRGLGLADPATQTEIEAMQALKERRPYTTGAGEIVGEAAPFVPAAVATGGISAIAPRVLGSAALGAAEGGIVARGTGGEAIEGAGVGAGMAAGAEILFPVIGKLGRKIFQKATGRVPKGAMLDTAGRPTPELQEALDAAGMTFDDLTQDAAEVIQKQTPGAEPEQVARAARFAEEGIPATKGEITQDFGQRATEQRLLESAEDVAAGPLREFKLKQSEAIKESLRSNFGYDVTQEETGQLIQDALSGRKKLLRSQKNELYDKAAEAAKDAGGLHVFTDNIAGVVPDADTLEDLGITAPAAIKSLDQILTKYGIKEPTQEAIEAGFKPTPLTIDNVERFRKTLNAIERGDQTGAVSVATGPIKKALDSELNELGSVLKGKGVSEDIFEPLLEARKTVRELKTEFSPQSIIGRIIDVKKDGATQITEASKVYDKLIARSMPVENIRKVISSLAKSGEKGKQATASIQTTTIMDLIDAGFGTESRKVRNIKIFNPIAFKRRLKNIGEDKIKAIFKDNKDAFKKIQNIEKIATDLIPEAGAVPKGSASVILDLMNKLGVASIATKIPGGAFVLGSIKQIADPVKTGVTVKKAMKGEPDIQRMSTTISESFPGLSSALGIAATVEETE